MSPSPAPCRALWKRHHHHVSRSPMENASVTPCSSQKKNNYKIETFMFPCFRKRRQRWSKSVLMSIGLFGKSKRFSTTKRNCVKDYEKEKSRNLFFKIHSNSPVTQSFKLHKSLLSEYLLERLTTKVQSPGPAWQKEPALASWPLASIVAKACVPHTVHIQLNAIKMYFEKKFNRKSSMLEIRVRFVCLLFVYF